MTVKIGIIGDIHLDFDQADVNNFNASEYNLLLFVGDLSELFKPHGSLTIARYLSQLTKPAVFIPGNHDVHNVWQIIAEVLGSRALVRLSGLWHYRYHQHLREKLRPVKVGGYSIHPYQFGEFEFDLICARPYAMGGSQLSFSPLLRRLYGIRTKQDSIDLLCCQVDGTRSQNLIFLAHNGPHGLGDQPADIWGCDFDPRQGDFGDRDLTAAVEYAQSQGKRVLAVIAGHMHLQTYLGPKPVWQRRGTPGPIRPWYLERAGIHYVNAARVPRILTRGDGKSFHHHIEMWILGSEISIREKMIAEE
jgi:uncharacterized protein (TIGR04168 family)